MPCLWRGNGEPVGIRGLLRPAAARLSAVARAPLQAFQDEALDALRRVLPFDSSMWGSATPGAENVFTISQGSRSYVGGMGCKARCAVDSTAIHKRRNAADRPPT